VAVKGIKGAWLAQCPSRYLWRWVDKYQTQQISAAGDVTYMLIGLFRRLPPVDV
jgi:hypothetical protein